MIDMIFTVAATEIRIGLRNRWIIMCTVILLVFSLVLAFVGSTPTGNIDASALTITVASLSTLSIYLVPLMALLLGFDAIAGEVERGTLQLVLATPLSRGALIAGKFVGHLAVLMIAISAGYGFAGGAVVLISGDGLNGIAGLARLIATSFALGAAFLAIGYIASATMKQAGTAAAVVVGIWLFAVVLYDLALFGALVADADGTFATAVFPYLLVANPADAFRLYNMAALDMGAASTGYASVANTLPFPAELGIASLVLWTALALAAATAMLRRLEP